MGEITRALIARVGVDLAKRVIQVHVGDEHMPDILRSEAAFSNLLLQHRQC